MCQDRYTTSGEERARHAFEYKYIAVCLGFHTSDPLFPFLSDTKVSTGESKRGSKFTNAASSESAEIRLLPQDCQD